MATNWTNSDGLHLKMGVNEAQLQHGGTYNVLGPLQETEIKILATTIGSSAAILPANSVGVEIPSGVRIEEVEVVAETACTGAGAELNVGLIRLDRSTELDYNGLVAALALTAIDAAGEKTVIRVGSTGAGALIGTTLANPGILTFDYDTAAYTAGKIVVRVRYYNPQTNG